MCGGKRGGRGGGVMGALYSSLGIENKISMSNQ